MTGNFGGFTGTVNVLQGMPVTVLYPEDEAQPQGRPVVESRPSAVQVVVPETMLNGASLKSNKSLPPDHFNLNL